MDLSDTIIPRSDQLNGDDLLAGPRTVTITEVRKVGGDDQPVSVHLAEFPGRPLKPSKTVLRILVTAWGKDGDAYVGRRLTLYRDPDVKWGGQAVGGIRIQAMSHIKAPLKLALTETRGKKTTHIVKPLASEPATILPVNPPTTGITDAQLIALDAGLTGLGITDRETKLATVVQIIDREIKSARDLTRAEADAVINWIEHEEAADTEPTLPDGTDQ